MNKGITLGMDLGDKKHQVCVLTEAGEVMKQEDVSNTSAAVRCYFRRYRGAIVAMEVGTHSRWISQVAEEEGVEMLVGNTRKLRAIWSNDRKSDVRDAEMLARIARFDRKLLYPIRHRSAQAQADLGLIRARDLLVRSRAGMVSHVRDVVKGSGERLPSCSTECFGKKAQLPLGLQPVLAPIMEMIRTVTEQIRQYDRLIEKAARERYAAPTEVLAQAPGVGTLTALAYLLTVESPERFTRSRQVGAYFGLVPRRDQSGETDKQLRITKAGNGYMRRLLVGSAQYILGPFGPDCDLRTFGMRLRERGGRNAKKRAVVAVARKLAVLLHALWRSGAAYEPHRAAKTPRSPLRAPPGCDGYSSDERRAPILAAAADPGVALR